MWKRLVIPVPVGVSVTLGLLYVMHSLINAGEDVVTPIQKAPMIILRARVEEPVEPDPITPPDRIDPPPDLPPDPPRQADGDGKTSIRVSQGTPPSPPPNDMEFGLPMSDGPLVAIVRVAPEYPASMSARSVEGFVTVRFDVDREGRTANISVVDSTHAGFERAAVRAAEKFRYRPRVVDGSPVHTTNLQYRFRFEMDRR